MDVADKEKNYICIGDKKLVCKLCNKQFSHVANCHKHNRNIFMTKKKEKSFTKNSPIHCVLEAVSKTMQAKTS